MKNKKVIFRILVVTASLILICGLYLNSNYFIRTQEWKHRDGGYVGDWVEFDNNFYSIKKRTIYKKEVAVGKVVFCLGEMLIIREISTGEKGYYINKTSF